MRQLFRSPFVADNSYKMNFLCAKWCARENLTRPNRVAAPISKVRQRCVFSAGTSSLVHFTSMPNAHLTKQSLFSNVEPFNLTALWAPFHLLMMMMMMLHPSNPYRVVTCVVCMCVVSLFLRFVCCPSSMLHCIQHYAFVTNCRISKQRPNKEVERNLRTKQKKKEKNNLKRNRTGKKKKKKKRRN